MTSRAAIVLVGSLVAATVGSAADLKRGIELYWSGKYVETIEVLTSVQQSELRDDEAIECLKYLAFSHVALGDNDTAREVFFELLATDPAHALDQALVSPKIVKVFVDARAELIDSWFQEGKSSYFDKNYAATRRTMNRILLLDPDHALAKEYSQLASEQEILMKKTAALEEETTPPPTHVDVSEDSDDRVYHQTGGIAPAVLIDSVEPQYPASARRAGSEGTVVITVVIDVDGSVREMKVVRSVSPVIDQAALTAVKRWRYRPATKNGRPVAVYGVVNLAFQLER